MKIGDRVIQGGAWKGVVVGVIHADEYANDDVREIFSFLRSGIVVKDDEMGYILYDDESDLELDEI